MADFLNTYVFHWVPEKAIYIGGQSLLWDARCSGIYIGFGIGVLWMILSGRTSNNLPPWPILLVNTFMFAPMFIDLISLWTGVRKPSNDIRYLTGILFGGALSMYLYPAFTTIVYRNDKSYTSIKFFPIYTLFLLVSIGAFFIKEIDCIFVFWMLYGLSVLGFGCLVVMLLLSAGFLLKSLVSKQIIN